MNQNLTELDGHLTASNDTPFRFGYDSTSQKYGYIIDEGGADTFRPFSEMTEESVTIDNNATYSVTTGDCLFILTDINFTSGVYSSYNVYGNVRNGTLGTYDWTSSNRNYYNVSYSNGTLSIKNVEGSRLTGTLIIIPH